tara:strand:+ start:287 stop:877 length:591 start_codon:yes stop_codon:yes gene_type:complete
MATCVVTNNVEIECADESANAGLQSIYFAYASQLTAEPTLGIAEHTVTGVVLNGAELFVEMQGRFETKDITTEMTRENGGRRVERTLNCFIPNVEKVKANLLNEYSQGKKLFLIVSSYNKAGATNKRAYVFGYDSEFGKKDSGAMMNVGEIVEAEVGGQIGYNIVFTAVAQEPMREMEGTITVEDGATGTAIVFGV